MNFTVNVTLDKTLKEADISRNAIAVEGKIRPATISELCNGKSKSISFETLERIVDALNRLDSSRLHKIEDVITIQYDKKA
ncbi:helix-turn-helix transcriptional regulator [Sporosarcina saromensis]|uniref:Helix-turn-helix transcriptional regulator n=1 Tax=Sporosarcina saromensis TaxID=359365 RepID=A0ABU4G5E8_9BACL|nr:helix-turn-helix transcriptional regulator [Sporosarcina saromensis]MDW0112188.1 helix-turn-helix transcriptional regulator [Sporosarcina saromensis]